MAKTFGRAKMIRNTKKDKMNVSYPLRARLCCLLEFLPPGKTITNLTGPGCSVRRVSTLGNGRSWVSIQGSDIPFIKSGTSCSSLGTQVYGVELGLVDPVSG